jgi:hypothetical protein
MPIVGKAAPRVGAVDTSKEEGKTSQAVRKTRRRQYMVRMLGFMKKGYSVTQMSEELKCSYHYAYKMFAQLKKRIHLEQSASIEHLCSFVAHKYDVACGELLEAWDNSKTDPETGKNKNPNIEYMQGLLDALRELRKLMGLDKTNDAQANQPTQAITVDWSSLLKAGRALQQTDVKEAQALVSAATVDPVEQRIRTLQAKAIETDTVPAHKG